MPIKIHHLIIFIFITLLTGCSTFFDKDNTPEAKSLVQFTPSMKPLLAWSTQAGSGVGDEYLKNTPALSGNAIYTSSTNGTVTSVNKATGRVNWRVSTRTSITSGPGVGNDLVVVASRDGKITALNADTGTTRWQISLMGEALAAPAVSRGKVIVKTIDGYVRALSVENGRELWSFQQVEPNLILRGASNPLLSNRDVLVGFANGNLVKLTLDDGQLIWTQAVASPQGAFTIERMIDVDADPLLFNHKVYAATYQGNIASFDWFTGRTNWSHKISSYTGMAAGNPGIFVSDAKSDVWAFSPENGSVKWQQTGLQWRNVSGPAILGDYVIVGDDQGFLHWLRSKDGQFAAREYTGGSIYAAPVVENGVLYALTNKGRLLAYKLPV